MSGRALALRRVAMRKVWRRRAAERTRHAQYVEKCRQNKAVLEAEKRGEGRALLMGDGRYILVAPARVDRYQAQTWRNMLWRPNAP